ncbi:hypothetical protein OESDEN_08929 [Oesophagostomum dentatum]|uniref:Uncharacterized protein n=1 Tax=Oesophagostomum dentatum TaxID=61180 RepID=A0A0B1T512_OESDE|nr:hypothetical protein OESDEN_08929 [Oesophagostomum dentatum]
MICQYLPDSSGAYSYKCRPEGLLFYFHRYFLTGRPAANIALAAEAALLAIFWLCTTYMRREFTKVFTTVTVIPLTIRAGLIAFHTAVVLAIDFPDMKLVEALLLVEKILETTTCFAFMTGSTVYSAMAIHVARTKRAPNRFTGISIAYTIILVLLFVLSVLDTFPPSVLGFNYSKIITFDVPRVTLRILVMTITDVCWWSKRNATYSNDPVVFNAFSRMFWTIPLMVVSGLASLIDYVGNLSYDPYLSTISMALLPPTILIALFILLPGYRTALFCCCANNRLNSRIYPTMTILPSPAPDTYIAKQTLTPVVT